MCFHCQAVIWPCQSEVTQDSVHPRAHESNDPNRRSFVWMTHFKQMCVSDMSCHLDKNKLCFNTSFVLHRQHIYIFSLSLQCMKTHVCTCCEVEFECVYQMFQVFQTQPHPSKQNHLDVYVFELLLFAMLQSICQQIPLCRQKTIKNT